MREDRDYGRDWCRVEQNVEEAVAHIGQVVASVGALDLDSPVGDGLPDWGLDLANDLEDEGLQQIRQTR